MPQLSIPLQDIRSLTVQEAYDMETEGNRNHKVEQIVSLPIKYLLPFENHPFKVKQERVESLMNSIKDNGVLTPLDVRESKDKHGYYEIIAGHHRCEAARQLNMESLPCTIRNDNDNEAIIRMVDSNIQRGMDTAEPSELITALTMQHNALKNQGKRTDKLLDSNENPTCGNDCHKLNSAGLVGEQNKLSPRSVRLYVRIGNSLIKDFWPFIDDKKLTLVVAEQLSYLPENLQLQLLEYLNNHPKTKLSLPLAKQIRDNITNIKNNPAFLESLFHNHNQTKKSKTSLNIKITKLNKFLPPSLKNNEIEDYILKALQFYVDNQQMSC